MLHEKSLYYQLCRALKKPITLPNYIVKKCNPKLMFVITHHTFYEHQFKMALLVQTWKGNIRSTKIPRKRKYKIDGRVERDCTVLKPNYENGSVSNSFLLWKKKFLFIKQWPDFASKRTIFSNVAFCSNGSLLIDWPGINCP